MNRSVWEDRQRRKWLAGRQEAVTVTHERCLLLDPCKSTSDIESKRGNHPCLGNAAEIQGSKL